jgi:S-adenosylmethionine synthetase
MKRHLFTSESVTEGHPDKICDHISDAVLDAVLAGDRMGRVACETSVTTGLVLVAGEITTKVSLDIPKIAREAIRKIGYDNAAYGFDCNTCAVIVAVDKQSPDIDMGVSKALEVRGKKKLSKEDIYNSQGAGDQGMVFGFACNETKEFMPMPISLAHKLCLGMSAARRNGKMGYLRPDGKSQVTVVYENGRPASIDTVILSSQHSPDVSLKKIHDDMRKFVLEKVVPARLIKKDTRLLVNPTGRFVIGGPMGDTGLTGRKIIVDTYGGYSRHGGGAFSGKDPSKVDRSGTYMARYAAKNIVASGAAEKCEIQIGYSIGVAKPVSIYIDTFCTEKVAVEKIEKAALQLFDFRPAAIIDNLKLRRPIYSKTASYGHFGRELPEFTWEKLDKVSALKKMLGL